MKVIIKYITMRNDKVRNWVLNCLACNVLCCAVLWLQVEQKLQAKEAEVQELMAMCDQLLQQQEARGG